MKRRVLMLAAVGFTGIALAIPAHADDNAYLHELSTLGICTDHYAAPGDSKYCRATFPDDAALALGRQVCQGYSSGMDPGEVEAALRGEAPINSRTAQDVRLAALAKLC